MCNKAPQLCSGSQSSHTPPSPPVPKWWNLWILPDASDRSGSATSAGQPSNCESVSESLSLSENRQQAFITSYHRSLNQEAKNSTYEAIHFHFIFVK